MVHICFIPPDGAASLRSLSNIGVLSRTWLYQDFIAPYWLVRRTTSPKRIVGLPIVAPRSRRCLRMAKGPKLLTVTPARWRCFLGSLLYRDSIDGGCPVFPATES